jgi:hypothetical protein
MPAHLAAHDHSSHAAGSPLQYVSRSRGRVGGHGHGDPASEAMQWPAHMAIAGEYGGGDAYDLQYRMHVAELTAHMGAYGSMEYDEAYTPHAGDDEGEEGEGMVDEEGFLQTREILESDHQSEGHGSHSVTPRSHSHNPECDVSTSADQAPTQGVPRTSAVQQDAGTSTTNAPPQYSTYRLPPRLRRMLTVPPPTAPAAMSRSRQRFVDVREQEEGDHEGYDRRHATRRRIHVEEGEEGGSSEEGDTREGYRASRGRGGVYNQGEGEEEEQEPLLHHRQSGITADPDHMGSHAPLPRLHGGRHNGPSNYDRYFQTYHAGISSMRAAGWSRGRGGGGGGGERSPRRYGYAHYRSGGAGGAADEEGGESDSHPGVSDNNRAGGGGGGADADGGAAAAASSRLHRYGGTTRLHSSVHERLLRHGSHSFQGGGSHMSERERAEMRWRESPQYALYRRNLANRHHPNHHGPNPEEGVLSSSVGTPCLYC